MKALNPWVRCAFGNISNCKLFFLGTTWLPHNDPMGTTWLWLLGDHLATFAFSYGNVSTLAAKDDALSFPSGQRVSVWKLLAGGWQQGDAASVWGCWPPAGAQRCTPASESGQQPRLQPSFFPPTFLRLPQDLASLWTFQLRNIRRTQLSPKVINKIPSALLEKIRPQALKIVSLNQIGFRIDQKGLELD